MTSAHLSNEDFTDMLLLGEQNASATQHLATCARCRQELAVFSESVGLFSSTSLAVCDARPAPSLRAKAIQHSALRVTRQRLLLWTPLAVACAVFGVSVRLNHQPHPHISITSVAATDFDSPDTIARDNQLLENVNLALNTSESSPLPEDHLIDAAPRARTRTP